MEETRLAGLMMMIEEGWISNRSRSQEARGSDFFLQIQHRTTEWMSKMIRAAPNMTGLWTPGLAPNTIPLSLFSFENRSVRNQSVLLQHSSCCFRYKQLVQSSWFVSFDVSENPSIFDIISMIWLCQVRLPIYL